MLGLISAIKGVKMASRAMNTREVRRLTGAKPLTPKRKLTIKKKPKKAVSSKMSSSSSSSKGFSRKAAVDRSKSGLNTGGLSY